MEDQKILSIYLDYLKIKKLNDTSKKEIVQSIKNRIIEFGIVLKSLDSNRDISSTTVTIECGLCEIEINFCEIIDNLNLDIKSVSNELKENKSAVIDKRIISDENLNFNW